MAHEVKYRYRAYMPIDGTRNIVHVEAITPRLGTYRFISFEYSPRGLCVLGVRCAPDDALHLEVRKTDEKEIKLLLAQFNHHDEDHLEEIEIVVGEPVRGRRGGIPDSSEYVASRIKRSRRYSHGLDPDMPPPGWIPD